MMTINTKYGIKIIEPIGNTEPWPASLSSVLASLKTPGFEADGGNDGRIPELASTIGTTLWHMHAIVGYKAPLSESDRQAFKDNFGWTDENLPIEPELQSGGLERKLAKQERAEQIEQECKKETNDGQLQKL